MKYILIAIAAIAGVVTWWYKSRYDPDSLREQAKKKADETLDKKKAELKSIEMEISDVQKNLNDAVNLGVTVLVNDLSVRLTGLCKRRDELNADIST